MPNFVCPQCVGHLEYQASTTTLIIVMSTSNSVADTLDLDSFELQLDGSVVSLPRPSIQIASGRTRYSWSITHSSAPTEAVLTMSDTSSTSYELELALAVQGAA